MASDNYEGEKWFFPFEDDVENGDLVERVIDARCAYWKSTPIKKNDLPTGVKIGAPVAR